MLNYVKFSLECIAKIISRYTLWGYTVHIFFLLATLRAPRRISFWDPPWRSGATHGVKASKFKNRSSAIILRSLFGKLQGNILY
jgi:hypothetical protein